MPRTWRAAGLKDKAQTLLGVLEEDPYQTPPPFEKLVGDLSGAYSRRINIQHRLVYQVLEDEQSSRCSGCGVTTSESSRVGWSVPRRVGYPRSTFPQRGHPDAWPDGHGAACTQPMGAMVGGLPSKVADCLKNGDAFTEIRTQAGQDRQLETHPQEWSRSPRI